MGFFKMNETDLKIDTFTNGVSPVRMKVTHLPTGKTVSDEGRSVYKLKKNLIKKLSKELS